jgi:FMN phosphatase YigB (HAD superfamily)
LIKTIIFDLGKVIIPFDVRRGYAALAPHCGVPAAEIPRRIAATDLVERFEAGQVSPEDFVARLSADLELKVDYNQFCELWSSIFLPETLIQESLFEALHPHYRLLLLSNTNAIHFALVRERYPLFRHFDYWVLSHEVGAAKPDPRIYQAALDHALCAPSECFFTDDIPLFVETARALGIDAVVFESQAQIERELRARGVCW